MTAWLRKPLPFGMWLATCFVIGLLFAGGLLLYDQVRSNRAASIEALCEHDNLNAQNNIDFLGALRVDPSTLRLARRTFKTTPDCRAFAKRTVEP